MTGILCKVSYCSGKSNNLPKVARASIECFPTVHGCHLLPAASTMSFLYHVQHHVVDQRLQSIRLGMASVWGGRYLNGMTTMKMPLDDSKQAWY